MSTDKIILPTGCEQLSQIFWKGAICFTYLMIFLKNQYFITYKKLTVLFLFHAFIFFLLRDYIFIGKVTSFSCSKKSLKITCQ